MATPDPFGSETRRLVARACSERALSVGDLGRILKRPDGSLRTVVKAMNEEGVLEPAPLPGRVAKGYLLSAQHEAALREALALQHPLGLLAPEQRLLVVAGRELEQLAAAVQAASVDPALLWVARTDGAARFVLAFDGSDPDPSDRTEVALRRGGAEVLAMRVARTMGPAEAVAWGRDVAGPHGVLGEPRSLVEKQGSGVSELGASLESEAATAAPVADEPLPDMPPDGGEPSPNGEA